MDVANSMILNCVKTYQEYNDLYVETYILWGTGNEYTYINFTDTYVAILDNDNIFNYVSSFTYFSIIWR